MGEGRSKHPPSRTAYPAPPAPEPAWASATHLSCDRWESFVQLHDNSLARGRLLLRTPEAPALGTVLRLSLSLPSGQEIELTGRVVKTAPPGEGEPLARVGVALDVGAAQEIVFAEALEQARAAMNPPRLPRPSPQPARRATPQPDERPRDRASRQPPPHPARRASQVPIPAPSRTPPPRALTPVPRPTHTPLPRPSREPPPRPSQWTAPSPAARSGGPVIGIDFGTSSCSVAYLQQHVPALIADESGRTSIPSLVWFRRRGDHVVGAGARDKLGADPARTVRSIKRLLGARFDDEAAAAVLGSHACPSRAGPDRSVVFDLNGEKLTPASIAAIILRRLRMMAETYLSAKVTRAVIAHPIAFSERQRGDLVKAARAAGFELMELIPEPVAVAMAYDVDRRRSGVIGVYDFGAGCFDFCALSMKEGVVNVIAAGGDPWLGGDDLDLALAHRVVERFHQQTGIDLRGRNAELQRIRCACEEAKVYLSLVDSYDVVVPGVAQEGGRSIDLAVPLNRGELDALARRAAARTVELCRRSLQAAGLGPGSIADLLLTGGTTKVPVVRDAARELFGCEPSTGVHPEQAVVSGATIRAAELEGRRPSWDPPQPSPNPLVAGRTVGLALSVGETSPIIVRSMPLPATARRIFSTSHDGQTSISLKIVEGEHRLASENRQVGGVNVKGLRPLPAGEGHVEVTFELDLDGTLNVTARDLTTGRTYESSFELGKPG